MSKKRHRNREASDQRGNNNQMNSNRINNGSNNPFGINPAQLLNLFGGTDMSQLGNMLSSMGREGFDLSNFGALGNMMQGGNINQNANNMNNNQWVNGMPNVGNMQGQSTKTTSAPVNSNNMDNENLSDKTKNKHNSINTKKNHNVDDENIEFLRAIRIIVEPSKVEFIDKIIEKYSEGLFDD